MAFRYMPHLDTVTLPNGNTMTVDPMIAEDAAPGTASEIGLDCPIPIGPKFERSHFDRSTVFELGDPPADVVMLSEEELTAAMAALIREAPRTWKEILQHFNGQSYRRSTGRSAIFGTNSDVATTNRGTATRSPTPTLRSTCRNPRPPISTRSIGQTDRNLKLLGGKAFWCHFTR
jgi:hypothetical protein